MKVWSILSNYTGDVGSTNVMHDCIPNVDTSTFTNKIYNVYIHNMLYQPSNRRSGCIWHFLKSKMHPFIPKVGGDTENIFVHFDVFLWEIKWSIKVIKILQCDNITSTDVFFDNGGNPCSTTVQSQKAVSAYFTSNQILPFAFVLNTMECLTINEGYPILCEDKIQ